MLSRTVVGVVLRRAILSQVLVSYRSVSSLINQSRLLSISLESLDACPTGQ